MPDDRSTQPHSPPPTQPPQQQPYGQQPYGQPQGQPPAAPPATYGAPAYGQPPQTSTKAILSLVFSIVGFFVLPLVLHIVGIVLGNSAKQEISADPNVSGDGLATAGIVLGWIGIGFAVLIFLVIITMVTGMAGFGRFLLPGAAGFINPMMG